MNTYLLTVTGAAWNPTERVTTLTIIQCQLIPNLGNAGDSIQELQVLCCDIGMRF